VLAFVGGSTPFPAEVTVVDPAQPNAAGWTFHLEVEAPAETPGLDTQGCVQPLPAIPPTAFLVDFLIAPDFNAGTPPWTATLSEAESLFISYDTGFDGTANGFDLLAYEVRPYDFLPDRTDGVPHEIVFDWYLPKEQDLLGEFTYPPTPLPIFVENSSPLIYLETVRIPDLGSGFEELFDFGLVDELRLVAEGGYCFSANSAQFSVVPDAP
jgi:hypothetical protein